MRQRAVGFQTIDLLLQELVVHRELTYLRQEISEILVTLVARTGAQCRLGTGVELIAPLTQSGCRYAQVARDDVKTLATHQTQYGFGFLLHGKTTP